MFLGFAKVSGCLLSLIYRATAAPETHPAIQQHTATTNQTAAEVTNAIGGLMKNKDSTLTKVKNDVKERAKEEAKKEAKKQLGNFLKGLGGNKEE